jgi:signal transduction histidine kinase
METAKALAYRLDPPAGLLRIYRVLGILVTCMVLGFWFVHRSLEPSAWDPLWLRLFISGGIAAVVGLSYRIEWIRRHFALVASVILWIVLLWFGMLTLVNRLSPNYIVGYLLVYASAGVVYGLGLQRPEPLGVYLGVGWVGMALGSLWVADRGVSSVMLISALTGIGTTLYLVMRTLMYRQRELDEARAQAEAALRFSNALLANMHHELRTPLAGILGAAQILREEAPSSLQEFAHIIEHSGQRLLHLLTNLLLLARIEADRLRLKPSLVDLREIMHEVLQALKAQAEEKELELTCACPNVPVYVYADPEALHTVCYNVIENAIKFTSRGRVHLALRTHEDRLELEVQDTGPGIDSVMLERLLQAFEQGPIGPGRTHEGVGIGLTVARRLLELMEGRLYIESQPGQGTTVRISLRKASNEVHFAEKLS